MHIAGIGSDIVECLRIGRMMERHGEVFLLRVFTAGEVRHCQGRKRVTEHFAAHWAAKEAIFKALGTTWSRGLNWTDIDIHLEDGLPKVFLTGAVREFARKQQIGDVLLTMGHCRAYATAYALALRSGAVLG